MINSSNLGSKKVQAEQSKAKDIDSKEKLQDPSALQNKDSTKIDADAKVAETSSAVQTEVTSNQEDQKKESKIGSKEIEPKVSDPIDKIEAANTSDSKKRSFDAISKPSKTDQ